MPQRVQYEPPVSNNASSPTSSPIAQLGSILYRGPVPPTKGEWLGIEWDDPSRGKHSGVHEKTGVRYFETRVEGAGSFLRPNAPGLIIEGKSFREAFESKYLDGHSTTASRAEGILDAEEAPTTTSQFYKTASNFEVEIVLSEKVTARFRQLGRLREAGLEWESVGRAYDTVESQAEESLHDFGQKLSGLEILNLSYTMLPSIEEAERIARSLPKLSVLSLNSNRFDLIESPRSLPGFDGLSILKLNNTLITWPEIVRIAPSLSNLVDLELGFNRLSSLSVIDQTELPLLPKLETLNFESNHLSDWNETVQTLSALPNLKNLILTSNRFENLSLRSDPPSSSPTTLRKLRHLSLTSNLLSAWSTSIDALGELAPTVLPSLTSLNLAGNPLPPISTSTESSSPESPTIRDREFLDQRLNQIARLPFLQTLESTAINEAEREDAERFWITQSQWSSENGHDDGSLSDWAKKRLKELDQKNHSSSNDRSDRTTTSNSTVSASTAPASLKSRLIRLRIVSITELPPPDSTGPSEFRSEEISILPTIRTLLVRTQLSRIFGKPLPKTKYQLVVWLQPKLAAGECDEEGEGENNWIRVEIPVKEEGRELSWWGVEDGDAIGVEQL
ncbi:hypothetical protein JCM5350_007226 [Sporobolomyces pararoseus]